MLRFLFVLIFTCFFQQISFAQQPSYKEKVLTTKRSEILLNNLWLFQPAVGTAAEHPNEGVWKKMRVPASWMSSNQDKIDYTQINRAWYQTEVFVPVSWQTRMTELELTKVSTDAIIYINDIKAGQINWYTGTVDLSKYLKFGKKNTIRILVVSTPNEGEIPILMGTATSQVTFTKATLESKGLIGDVLLSFGKTLARGAGTGNGRIAGFPLRRC